jgi:hypothetical protein
MFTGLPGADHPVSHDGPSRPALALFDGAGIRGHFEALLSLERCRSMDAM